MVQDNSATQNVAEQAVFVGGYVLSEHARQGFKASRFQVDKVADQDVIPVVCGVCVCVGGGGLGASAGH